MSYRQFGISTELVERVKSKLKNKQKKERIKAILQGVTKADLQNSQRVKRLGQQIASELNEPLPPQQLDNMVRFVIAQKIDPHNTFHLIRLWSMFQ